jgi:hypothetical protein
MGFISIDPVAARAGDMYNFNRYAYANNSPMMFVDADGMDADPNNAKDLQGYTVNGADLLKRYYFDGWGGVSFGRGGSFGVGGGACGGGIATEKPITVTADRPADPTAASITLKADQRWYCTPGAASVAGATAGGVVTGGLTGMVDLRGNPYGIAVGAAVGGVVGGSGGRAW